MGIDDDADVEQQKYIAAHAIAAAEADAWAEVRDRRLRAAVPICRDERGMSMRATANALRVSKSTLSRNIWNAQSTSPAEAISRRAREFDDEILIRVGLGHQASPQARFAAGLISEYERDALLDYARRQQISIPDQIREAVEKFPGITNLDLPRMIVMAALKGTVPDLRRHAEAARCKVDIDDRWWPSC